MQGPLPIALCITDLEVGGAERCLVELATRVRRHRFAPVVYSLAPRPTQHEDSLVARLEAARIPVHHLGARRIWEVCRVLGKLRRLLETQKPRLVQTFLFHANLLGRLAAKRAVVPRVVSGIRVAERQNRWHLWLDRWTSRWVDRYVCVSEAVARFSREKGGLAADKVLAIPNGIDLREYPAPRPANLAALGIPSGHQVVTYVGRLDRQKNVAWLVENAPVWLGEMPDCDLLLVGRGPQRAALERLARQVGMGDRVHLAGWRHDVPAILASSRLLVLPSRWEGMPNAVLEAMASALPVLATDAEGVAELLGPAADEQTVPVADAQAFAAKVVRLVRETAAAADLGRRNRRRVQERFGIDRMVEAYERLWNALISTHEVG